MKREKKMSVETSQLFLAGSPLPLGHGLYLGTCVLVGSQPCAFSQSGRRQRAKASGPPQSFYSDRLTLCSGSVLLASSGSATFYRANVMQSGLWLCPQARGHQNTATSSKLMTLYPWHIFMKNHSLFTGLGSLANCDHMTCHLLRDPCC